MSKNYLQIQVDGEKIGLKFNMGAFDVITADEELVQQKQNDKGTRSVAQLVYAGMVGVCCSKEQEPDFTIEDVKKKLKKLDFDELEELGKEISEVVGRAYPQKDKEVSGEGNTNTQPQQTLNVA